jgi:hypothetical protein
MSKTAGSSVNSKDKDPKPISRVAASATPVTPPTYTKKRNSISSLRKRRNLVSFLNFSKK